ncbi:Variant surface glycoprotein [Trypanosoma congolense IL3000]|uniref:Variant surface glycoprotein n=1 Tax=Trypanosoma congolense (strain IL3000) TaxID=1068625 RepID=F9W9N7_TRYCI|nr:Variant surface glycoprotein [Trypanosoma congolense IL3000]
MVWFMNVLLASVFVCSLWGEAAAQGAEVKSIDNAEQFALLCRIYNVAKNPPINHVDLQDPYKIVEEIVSINASFAEEKRLNETEQVGNSSYDQVKPTTTREAAVAQAILRRITQKAHKILEDILNMKATRDIKKIKAEFAQVIFGEDGNESDLCHGALKGVSGRAEACGMTGLSHKGASAGENLVVDFFCLCAQNTEKNNGIEKVCGVQVGGKGDKHGWSDQGPLGSASMWVSIKKGCENLLHQHPKSTEEGHEIIRDFLKHLETGGVYHWGSNTLKGSDRKAGMLGTAAGSDDGAKGSDLVCDGKKGYAGGKKPNGSPPGGICVYYGSEDEWQNIPWLNQFKTTLNTVDAVNNKAATIQGDIQKLQMLLHRAEEIYVTAKMITEIQSPQGLAAFTNTTAKRLTAFNAVRRYSPYHFIPAWMIFL